MKIVSSGKVLNSSKLYKKKRRKKLLKLSFLFLLFCSTIWSLIYISRQERFLVAEVIIAGEDIVDRSKMTERIKGLLQGYYFWFIPRANVAVLPRSEIRASLLEEFKRLKKVDIDINERTLVISLEERVPEALYCLDALRPNPSGCYFIDVEALIFARAPAFSGPSYLIYGTETAIEEPIGKSAMPAEEFRALSAFLENLKNLDIRARALEVGNDGYTMLTDRDTRIMWKKEHGFDRTYLNLDAFLSEESIRAQKDFLERVSYLDLRVEDKVFYRFRK